MGVVEGQENLKLYITNFYKNLFGDSGHSVMSLDPAGVDIISSEDGEVLIRRFMLEGLKDAVFSMEKKQVSWAG